MNRHSSLRRSVTLPLVLLATLPLACSRPSPAVGAGRPEPPAGEVAPAPAPTPRPPEPRGDPAEPIVPAEPAETAEHASEPPPEPTEPEPGAPIVVPVNPAALQSFNEQRALRRQADDALAAGDRASAHAALDRISEIEPQNAFIASQMVSAARLQARLYREEREYRKALGAVEKARARFPENVPLRLELAHVQLDFGHTREALEALEGLTGRRHREADYLRARALFLEEKPVEALAALERAIGNGFRDLARIDAEVDFANYRTDSRFIRIVDRLRTALGEEERLRKAELGEDEPRDLGTTYPGPRMVEALERNLANGNGRELTFDLPAVDGSRLRLEDHLGKPAVVFLWGPWSVHSEKQLPAMTELAKEQSEKLTVLHLGHVKGAVSPDVARMELGRHLEKAGIGAASCGVLMDYDLPELVVPGFPTTYFVGAEGFLYLHAPGYLDPPTVREMARVLVETEPAPPRERREPPR